LSEPLEGEEGVAVDFPLSRAWWASIFNLFLAWEDCTGEWSGESWKMGLIDGGAGKDKLGQPRCWETIMQTVPCHPSFFRDLGLVMRHEEVQGYQGLARLGKEDFQA
jgi:hypothetical protein